MNILDYLDSKERKNLNREHPFVDKTDEFKYIYCFGIATLAFGYKKNLPDIGRCFTELLRNMNVDEKKEKQIISSVYTIFDFKITEVFQNVTKKEEQYCFIADLYKIVNASLLSPTYCQDIINGYMKAFYFSSEERSFFKEFMECAAKIEMFNGNSMKEKMLEEAKEIYNYFQNNGYRISYQLLKYMLPTLEWKKTIASFNLSNGEKMMIDFPVEFFGKCFISNGSSLIIENTTVIFHNMMQIISGKVSIRNSKVIVAECEEESLFNIEETALFQIENCEIDCKGKTAFVHQNKGNLYIRRAIIEDTKGKSAIIFSGRDINIEETSFLHCSNGAIWNDAEGMMKINACHFSYCRNEHGGAVYSQSSQDTYIENCIFHHCIAKYLGGAVYFANRKYGQWIEQCKFEECAPRDSVIFNEYHYILKTNNT